MLFSVSTDCLVRDAETTLYPAAAKDVAVAWPMRGPLPRMRRILEDMMSVELIKGGSVVDWRSDSSKSS